MLKFSSFSIPDNEIEINFVKSSGAGGQNVNKVNTKAVLKWNIITSKSTPKPIKKRFIKRWSNKISKKGELTLTSDKYRYRSKNIEEIITKLRNMIKEIIIPPKKRVKTKPSKGVIEKRLKLKKIKSQTKDRRKKPLL